LTNTNDDDTVRQLASEGLFSVLGTAVKLGRRRHARRATDPPPPKYPDFRPGSEQRLLLVQGMGTHSGEGMLDRFAEQLPTFSAAQYSYRGRIDPIYDELDSITGATNVAQAATRIDEYFPSGGTERRLIVAHSLGGVVAYEWAWRRRLVNSGRSASTMLFLIASPVFVSIPRAGQTIRISGEDGTGASLIIRNTTFPPRRVPIGIERIGSTFCVDDLMAPQPLCKLPEHPSAINYPPQDENHGSVCQSQFTRDYLADFMTPLN
jgi:pimeloyl-ACP methyl ester carboxylesterase